MCDTHYDTLLYWRDSQRWKNVQSSYWAWVRQYTSSKGCKFCRYILVKTHTNKFHLFTELLAEFGALWNISAGIIAPFRIVGALEWLKLCENNYIGTNSFNKPLETVLKQPSYSQLCVLDDAQPSAAVTGSSCLRRSAAAAKGRCFISYNGMVLQQVQRCGVAEATMSWCCIRWGGMMLQQRQRGGVS